MIDNESTDEHANTMLHAACRAASWLTGRHGERLHCQGGHERAALPEHLARQLVLGPLLIQHLPVQRKPEFLLSCAAYYDNDMQATKLWDSAARLRCLGISY